MQAPVICEVGHLAVRVRDLDAAEAVATSITGLQVTERTADEVWLSHGAPHHSLHYIRDDIDAVDHVGLVAPDAESIAEVRRRVDAAGLRTIADGPLGRGVSDGFAFQDAEGFVFEIYSRMAQAPAEVAATNVVIRPRRLGHINFFPRDAPQMQKMLIDVLDFRVSDWAGEGAFMRCNVDHHGIGVFPGPGVLHHYAWELPTIVELGAIADFIDARGESTLWGPMRHGIGGNIATYIQDPSGLVVEFYSDMQRIYNDATHVPGHWDTKGGHKWMSLWAPQLAVEGFRDMGLAPVIWNTTSV
jgi:catechol-2,3-dioxygenase